MNPIVIKKLDSPDEVRIFDKGRFELIEIGGLVLGRATYEPGWKWSVHVWPVAGTASCQVSHVGLVLQGRAMVRMDDGAELELKAGDVFAIPPGHDSWVLGDKPYVSLHLSGAGKYARREEERSKVVTLNLQRTSILRRRLCQFATQKQNGKAICSKVRVT